MKTLRADLQAQLDIAQSPTTARLLRVFLLNPGYWSVARYRLSAWCHNRRMFRPFAKFFWYLNVMLSGCYIAPSAKIGPGLGLPHATGIVIGEGCVIGADVTIYQHVTLGRRKHSDYGYPVIGNGVTIYAGACIAGAFRVGDNATIGANAVVLNEVSQMGMVRAPASVHTALSPLKEEPHPAPSPHSATVRA